MEEPQVFAKVVSALQQEGYEILAHVPGSHKEIYQSTLEIIEEHRITIGGKYPDLIGFSPTEEVIAVEVKGTSDIEKGIGQALTYQQGSHASFLAADWESVQPKVDQLTARGIGILGVEPHEDGISHWHDPVGVGSQSQLQDVEGELVSQFRLGGRTQRIGTVSQVQPLNFLAPVLSLAGTDSMTAEELKQALKQKYDQKPRTSGHSIDGARVLGLIDSDTYKLTEEGELATTVLAGEDVSTLEQLLEYKSNIGTVLVETHPSVATFLRNRYLQHPDVKVLVEVLDGNTGGIPFIDLLETLITEYPNVYLNVFCTSRSREEARKLIRQGNQKAITEQREKWEQFLRSNIILNFVQQLKHVGILSADTPSHSGKLSEFDPENTIWKLRSQ